MGWIRALENTSLGGDFDSRRSERRSDRLGHYASNSCSYSRHLEIQGRWVKQAPWVFRGFNRKLRGYIITTVEANAYTIEIDKRRPSHPKNLL